MKHRNFTTTFQTLSFTLFLMFALSSAKVSAQCQASFTWVQTSNNVIAFTDASTGISPGTFYTWNFGDGGYSYAASPVYTYINPGTYNVCLAISDSNGNCTSSFCDSVTVTGTINCNLFVNQTLQNPSCPSCTDGAAALQVTGGNGVYTYLWGDGETTNPAIHLGYGTYTFCVTDGNGCSYCDSVVIQSSSCNAAFLWTQNSPNTILFADVSTGTSPLTNYHWNFGDGNYSFAQNPSHFYTTPGNYLVCLMISDSNGGCNSSICQTISVTGQNCFIIVGNVLSDATCSSCSDGVATYFIYSGTATPPYTYSWTPAVSTGATASGLAPGYYSVVMTDANGCTSGTTMTVSYISNPTCSAYFQLWADSTQTHTYWALCSPMLNTPGNYLWSWGDGSYDSLPYPSHTYAAAGFYTICLTVTDSSGCTATYCDSMYLARMSSMVQVNVVPAIPSGISSAIEPRSLNLFPNPVNGKMSISYSLPSSSYIHIDLFDMVGNKMLTVTDEMKQSGEQKTELDAGKLPAGIYFLQIKSNGNVITKKVSVLH